MRTIETTSLLIALLPLNALAKTPDGEPPAEETVCSPFKGNAFGLCNSYCEAMDCNDPRVRAANPACETTADKFLKITKLEAMPCADIQVCTVDAQDDWLTMNDPQAYSVTPLENDTFTPAEAQLFVKTYDAAEGVTFDPASNTFHGTWSGQESTYNRVFTYTACCSQEVCDTATITILGS